MNRALLWGRLHQNNRTKNATRIAYTSYAYVSRETYACLAYAIARAHPCPVSKAGLAVMTILGIAAFAAALLVGLFVAGSLSRCTNVQANVFIWPGKVHCTTPPPAAVLAAVEEVLTRDGPADELSRDSLAALQDIAREVGGEPVVCAVSEVLDETPDMSLRSRIQHFLIDHDITVFRSVR